jgi:hypothetical protein
VTKSAKPKVLRRYTDLAATIDLLTNRRIVLLDPALWDDKNDSYFLQRYRAMTGAKSVLALCMTSVGETYHHWRVFCGNGNSGVCIEFDRKSLIEVVGTVAEVRRRAVRYLTLNKIAVAELELEDLPFIKRWPFRHELEYRLIYVSRTVEESAHPVAIPLSVIRRITLSPWLPEELFKATRMVLQNISGCADVPITRSRLISNTDWKKHADRLVPQEPLQTGVSSKLTTRADRDPQASVRD